MRLLKILLIIMACVSALSISIGHLAIYNNRPGIGDAAFDFVLSMALISITIYVTSFAVETINDGDDYISFMPKWFEDYNVFFRKILSLLINTPIVIGMMCIPVLAFAISINLLFSESNYSDYYYTQDEYRVSWVFSLFFAFILSLTLMTRLVITIFNWLRGSYNSEGLMNK